MKRRVPGLILSSALLCAAAIHGAESVPRLTPQDRSEIEQLVYKYAFALDHCTDNGESYASLYVPDGEFGGTTDWDTPPAKLIKGHDELAKLGGGSGPGGSCKDPKLARNYGATHVTLDLILTPVPGGVLGRSAALLIGADGDPNKVVNQGGKRDFFVKTKQGWRFKSEWHVSLPPRVASAAPSPAPITNSNAPAVQFPPPDPVPHPFSMTRSDPALDALIAPDAKLKLVAGGFGFVDTPLWVRGQGGAPGFLAVVSIIDNVVYKIDHAGKVSVFIDKAGYSGDDFLHDGKFAMIGRMHVLLMGPGCVAIDNEGRFVWCAGQDRAIKRLEKDGTRTVLTDKADGKRYNGPNDVAIAADGAIYFTDSDVGLRGGIRGGLSEMPDSVWRWKDGKVTMVVSRDTLGAEPNGIALSPDDKYLYLSAGTGGGDPKMMRYPINADGTAGTGELFTHGPGIGDGMKADRAGNIWSTDARPGNVRITSPNGTLLGLLHLPTMGDAEPRKSTCAASLAFGGDDAKTLYISACEHIYSIPLRTAGRLQGPAP
jgi:gluconolactonase